MKIQNYRYQLSLEQSLFIANAKEVFGKDPDLIVDNKNQIFLNALNQVIDIINSNYENQKKELNARIAYTSENKELILLRIGKPRENEHYKKDMVSKIKNYDWNNFINVFINNSPLHQLIGIELSNRITYNSIIDLLFKPLKKQLAQELLDFNLFNINTEMSFWEYVDAHKGHIKKLSITLFAKNMAIIDHNADEFMDNLRAELDAKQIELTATANKNGSLKISRESQYAPIFEKLSSLGYAIVNIFSNNPLNPDEQSTYNSTIKNVITEVNKTKLNSAFNEQGKVTNKTLIENIFNSIKDDCYSKGKQNDCGKKKK